MEMLRSNLYTETTTTNTGSRLYEHYMAKLEEYNKMIIECYDEEFDNAVKLLNQVEEKIHEKKEMDQEDHKILEDIQTAKNVLSDAEYLRFKYNLQ